MANGTSAPIERRRSFATLLLVAPATLWLLLFGVAPVVFLVVLSFWTTTLFGLTTQLTLDNYKTIFTDWVYAAVLLQTFKIALITTLSTLLLCYPVAYFLASREGRMKSVLLILLFLPFWTSYVVRTFVWLPMLGRNGLVNVVLSYLGVSEPVDWLLYNQGAVHVGLVYAYALFMILPIYLSIDKLDPALKAAAADLGAGPLRTFYRVTLPLTMPGVMSGSVMVFLLAVGAYVTPQLLGGTDGIMFGNVIAAQFFTTNNWALGAALSVVMMLSVLFVLLVTGRTVRFQQAVAGH